MKTEEIKTLKVEFNGDDADKFKSIVKKINTQEQKAGFTNTVLDADEKVLIRDLDDKLTTK